MLRGFFLAIFFVLSGFGVINASRADILYPPGSGRDGHVDTATSVAKPILFAAVNLFALPFGLEWGDSAEKVQKILKKQTTNVRIVPDKNLASGREVVDAQKFYDRQPFLVRCVFEKNKLMLVGITAVLAGYKNNLRRARELAKRFFINRLNKECILIKIVRADGVEKRFYKSDIANVETHCGKYDDKGAAIVSILYRSLSAQERLFPGAIFAAER